MPIFSVGFPTLAIVKYQRIVIFVVFQISFLIGENAVLHGAGFEMWMLTSNSFFANVPVLVSPEIRVEQNVFKRTVFVNFRRIDSSTVFVIFELTLF